MLLLLELLLFGLVVRLLLELLLCGWLLESVVEDDVVGCWSSEFSGTVDREVFCLSLAVGVDFAFADALVLDVGIDVDEDVLVGAAGAAGVDLA